MKPWKTGLRHTRIGFAILMAWAGWLMIGDGATAQQFRIETEVFSDSSQAIARSLTLFDGKTTYDFLMTAEEGAGDTPKFVVEEVVVFDQAKQRIHLLDQVNRQQLELGHSELLSLVAGMQSSEVLRARDEFLLEPKLTESFDPQSQQLQLSSPRLDYQVQGQKIADSQILAHYYSFADWAARLNATDSRKLPPFARLQLNQALKRRGWIPTEVQFQLTTLEGAKISATAKHHTLVQLSDNDQLRIESVKKQLAEFPSVSLSRYRNLTTATK
ncbi:MAG: hypothetical protein JNL67_15370 [Planctomycetaceae bacterium]|nr:hypothetical protein [Planctomycetaceae bacterium]